MNMLAIDFGYESSLRSGTSRRPTVRRTTFRRTLRHEPATLPLFPLEPDGPVKAPDRFDEDAERWDGLS